jgi:hypothetical protein
MKDIIILDQLFNFLFLSFSSLFMHLCCSKGTGFTISKLGVSQEKQDYDLGEFMTHRICVDMTGLHAL